MASRLRRVLRTLPGGRPQTLSRGTPPSLREAELVQRFPDAPEATRPFPRHLLSGAAGFVLGGLAVWGFGHAVAVKPPAVAPAIVAQAAPKAPLPAIKRPAYIARPRQPKLDSAPIPGPRYVHRAGSVLRDSAKASGDSLKKESKGAKVILESLQDDGWAKVTDGNLHGWMRASVLGVNPPEAK